MMKTIRESLASGHVLLKEEWNKEGEKYEVRNKDEDAGEKEEDEYVREWRENSMGGERVDINEIGKLRKKDETDLRTRVER